ncbi:MAG: nucleoside triphosphate pyrophosphohydrolase [Vicinamibacterales bacterium]
MRTTRSTRRASGRHRRAGAAFARLTSVMATLRSTRGCPWDREQTHETLRPFLLEETYEALEAIDRGDVDALRGELGDVLFQCVFQSQLAAEARRFDAADVIEAVTAKLIRRHPHVFRPDGRPLTGSRRKQTTKTPAAVLEQWEQIKTREQDHAGARRRLLTGVPRTMPALLRAHEIGTRVAAVGFDWPQSADVMKKIEEETAELRQALRESSARAAEELGDLLFTLANLARKLNLEPESALRRANDKFTRRFEMLEDHFEAAGRSIHQASLPEMEEAWDRAKSGSQGVRKSGSRRVGKSRSRSAVSGR